MKAEAIPVRTKIIVPGDDLLEVIAASAGPLLQKGDVLTIAESVVAIAQGRILRPEHVRPGFWARVLARFVSADGSLSSPYAMQAVMRECGTLRVLFAFLGGACGRLLGRKGDFYRLAGEQAALTDDITGTMPPFDKHIVLGPVKTRELVARVRRRFGVEAAVVDANDLGRTRVLAATPGVDIGLLLKVMERNPAGNAAEQTPLVIIRKQARS